MALPRKRSCSNCARAKRRCDLGLPACDRCLARGVVCVYPWTELAGTEALPGTSDASSFTLGDLSTIQNGRTEATTTSAVAGLHGLDLTPSELFSSPLQLSSATVPRPLSPVMMSLLDDIIQANPSTSSLPTSAAFGQTYSCIKESQARSSLLTSRALASERAITGHLFQARTEYAARRLAAQAGALASEGHNIFIHRTQIEASAVLRDAFAASALYAIRNTANATLVMREIMRRASLLVRTMTAVLASPVLLGTRIDPLPPLQALLVYQCLLRFGNLGESAMAISLREQAAHDQALLLDWMMLILHELKPIHEDRQQQHQQCQNQRGEESWRTWVRQESIRRTIVCAELVTGVDSFLTHGWDCADVRMAGLGFTAQVALWQAPSAEVWADIAYGSSISTTVSSSPSPRRPCLETGIFTFDIDQNEATPDDVDELAIVIRATNHGLDALADWLGRDWTQMMK